MAVCVGIWILKVVLGRQGEPLSGCPLQGIVFEEQQSSDAFAGISHKPCYMGEGLLPLAPDLQSKVSCLLVSEARGRRVGWAVLGCRKGNGDRLLLPHLAANLLLEDGAEALSDCLWEVGSLQAS